MTKSRIARQDLEVLRDLIDKYGRAQLKTEIDGRPSETPTNGRSLMKAQGRARAPIGRPPDYDSNIHTIWVHVEFWRLHGKSRKSDAFRKVEKILARYWVERHPPLGTVKTWYYQSAKLQKSDPTLRARLRTQVSGLSKLQRTGTIPIPIPLKRMADGSLESGVIDREGRGGRP
jgi:hypothetical protein